MTAPVFDPAFCETLEQLVIWRRDVRRFRTDAVDPALVRRLIEMSCLSPSVGNSQPWRFVLVDDPARRAAVRADFVSCNAEALNDYHGERAKLYATLKLAGLDDAPVHIAVFADHGTAAGHGLGQRTMPETLDYSVVAAIQTLWLLSRAHGLGLGWVSILGPDRVREALEVPEAWRMVAYLCLGLPEEEHTDPELVRHGWQNREEMDRFLCRR